MNRNVKHIETGESSLKKEDFRALSNSYSMHRSAFEKKAVEKWRLSEGEMVNLFHASLEACLEMESNLEKLEIPFAEIFKKAEGMIRREGGEWKGSLVRDAKLEVRLQFEEQEYQEKIEEKPTRKLSKWEHRSRKIVVLLRLSLILGALIFFLELTYFSYKYFSSESPDVLATYYERPVIGEEVFDLPPKSHDAFGAYQRHNFVKASHDLERLFEEEAIGEYAFYRGIALLELSEPSRAINCFNQSLEVSSNEALNAKSYWFIALAHLKQDNSALAKETLLKLSVMETDKKPLAEELLELLEEK